MTPLRASFPVVAAVVFASIITLVIASLPTTPTQASVTPQSGEVLAASAGDPIVSPLPSYPDIDAFSEDWTQVLADWQYRRSLDAAVADRNEKERVAAIEAAVAIEAERKAEAAAPPTTLAPATYSGGGACGGWGDLIAAHFGSAASQACSVMLCESNGNPNAHNPTSSASGLFQFLDSTWTSTTGLAPEARDYSPDTQIAAAAKLYRSSGWSPWVCRP